MEHLPGGLELRFHHRESEFPRRIPGDDSTHWEHPCYVNKGKHRYSDGIVYDAVGYQFYFEQNESIGLWGLWGNCGCLLRWGCLGYHAHDVEGVYILFDRETKEPRHVYFKAHGFGQGEWKRWEECDKTEDGALIVYFAVNSHATYFRDGYFRRIFGFANDRTSKRGRRILISGDHCIHVARTQNADDKPYRLEANVPDLSNISISARERTFFPLIEKKIRARGKAN